jgi:hypothetical protein
MPPYRICASLQFGNSLQFGLATFQPHIPPNGQLGHANFLGFALAAANNYAIDLGADFSPGDHQS